MNTSLKVCKERDLKGLYKKAINCEIEDFTGISSPYENPINPTIEIKTSLVSPEEAVTIILKKIKTKL